MPTEGNQSCSPEEAERVRALVKEILDSSATWIDKDDVEQPVTLDDILIIAPYNAQVFELQERLPGARIGTVDKFQGQEAPIVIYSTGDLERTRTRRAGWSFCTASTGSMSRPRARNACASGRVAVGVRGGVPHAAADAAGQRVLPLSGDGDAALRRQLEMDGDAGLAFPPDRAAFNRRRAATRPKCRSSKRGSLHLAEESTILADPGNTGGPGRPICPTALRS